MELVYDANADPQNKMIAAVKDVAKGYVHKDKQAEPGKWIALGDSVLKWYNIATTDVGVPEEIEQRAREFLYGRSYSGELDDLGGLGFVILHRCGHGFYFLLVSTWKNENELWESVYAKRSDDEPDFAEFTFESLHRPTFCVWEMAAVMHEKDAWRRFLVSSRTEDDKAVYLADHYSGTC